VILYIALLMSEWVLGAFIALITS